MNWFAINSQSSSVILLIVFRHIPFVTLSLWPIMSITTYVLLMARILDMAWGLLQCQHRAWWHWEASMQKFQFLAVHGGKLQILCAVVEYQFCTTTYHSNLVCVLCNWMTGLHWSSFVVLWHHLLLRTSCGMLADVLVLSLSWDPTGLDSCMIWMQMALCHRWPIFGCCLSLIKTRMILSAFIQLCNLFLISLPNLQYLHHA